MQVILRRGWSVVAASMILGLGSAVSAQPPAQAGPQDGEGQAQRTGEEQADRPPAAPPPAAAPAAQQAEVAQPSPGPSGTETDCQNGEDDDGDSMVDCADADCFGQAVCEAGGNPERNDERCSDWIDNDGDGAVDCDDSDCHGPGITVCEGSYSGGGLDQQHPGFAPDDDLPELTGDMTVEDLIGNFGDADGERGLAARIEHGRELRRFPEPVCRLALVRCADLRDVAAANETLEVGRNVTAVLAVAPADDIRLGEGVLTLTEVLNDAPDMIAPAQHADLDHRRRVELHMLSHAALPLCGVRLPRGMGMPVKTRSSSQSARPISVRPVR